MNIVSAGATAVRIGAKAPEKDPLSPLNAVVIDETAALTFGSYFPKVSKPSLTVAFSLRNKKNKLRTPKPYFRIILSPLLKPSLLLRVLFPSPSNALPARLAALAMTLRPFAIARPDNFASWIAAFFALMASFARNDSTPWPIIFARFAEA